MAQQIIFSSVPTSGYWTISDGYTSTAPLLFSATASDVSAATAVLSGGSYSVTGDYSTGFILDTSNTFPTLTVSTAPTVTASAVTVVETQAGSGNPNVWQLSFTLGNGSGFFWLYDTVGSLSVQVGSNNSATGIMESYPNVTITDSGGGATPYFLTFTDGVEHTLTVGDDTPGTDSDPNPSVSEITPYSLGIDEQQTVTVLPYISGGTFTLTDDTSQTTSAITFDSSAADFQTATQTAFTEYPDCSCGSADGGPWVFDFGVQTTVIPLTFDASALTIAPLLSGSFTVSIIETQAGTSPGDPSVAETQAGITPLVAVTITLGSEDGSDPGFYTRFDVLTTTGGWTPNDGSSVYVYQDGTTLVGTAICRADALDNPTTIDVSGGAVALSVDVGSLDGSTITLVPVSGSWVSAFSYGGQDEIQTVTLPSGISSGAWSITMPDATVVGGLAPDATASYIQTEIRLSPDYSSATVSLTGLTYTIDYGVKAPFSLATAANTFVGFDEIQEISISGDVNSGNFNFTLPDTTSLTISFDETSGDFQTAVQTSSYTVATVSGTAPVWSLDYGIPGSVALATSTGNTLGGTVTANVAFEFSGSGEIDLSGVGIGVKANFNYTSSGSISLAGVAGKAVHYSPHGSGSLSLSGVAVRHPVFPRTSSGSLSLSGVGKTGIRYKGSGSLSLAGSANPDDDLFHGIGGGTVALAGVAGKAVHYVLHGSGSETISGTAKRGQSYVGGGILRIQGSSIGGRSYILSGGGTLGLAGHGPATTAFKPTTGGSVSLGGVAGLATVTPKIGTGSLLLTSSSPAHLYFLPVTSGEVQMLGTATRIQQFPRAGSGSLDFSGHAFDIENWVLHPVGTVELEGSCSMSVLYGNLNGSGEIDLLGTPYLTTNAGESVEEGLVNYLLGQTRLTALVSNSPARIFYSFVPQNVDLLDGQASIVITLASGGYHSNLDGQSNWRDPSFTFDIIGTTVLQTVQIAERLRFCLSGFRGKMGSVSISNIILDDETDSYQAKQDGSDQVVYVKTITYIIQFSQFVPNFS